MILAAPVRRGPPRAALNASCPRSSKRHLADYATLSIARVIIVPFSITNLGKKALVRKEDAMFDDHDHSGEEQRVDGSSRSSRRWQFGQ